jgi:hypothetical protein
MQLNKKSLLFVNYCYNCKIMTQNHTPDNVVLAPLKTAAVTGVLIDSAAIAAMEGQGPQEVLPAAALGAAVGYVAALGAGASRTDRFTETTARWGSALTAGFAEGVFAFAQHAPSHWSEWIGTGARAGLSALSAVVTNLAMTKDIRPNR